MEFQGGIWVYISNGVHGGTPKLQLQVVSKTLPPVVLLALVLLRLATRPPSTPDTFALRSPAIVAAGVPIVLEPLASGIPVLPLSPLAAHARPLLFETPPIVVLEDAAYLYV